jgi:hypothetical protein
MSIATARLFEQDKGVPVKDSTESLATAFNAPKATTCGVLNRNGIFYATLKVHGEETPLEVALHGVRSETEAQEAFNTLIQLRMADCASTDCTTASAP